NTHHFASAGYPRPHDARIRGRPRGTARRRSAALRRSVARGAGRPHGRSGRRADRGARDGGGGQRAPVRLPPAHRLGRLQTRARRRPARERRAPEARRTTLAGADRSQRPAGTVDLSGRGGLRGDLLHRVPPLRARGPRTDPRPPPRARGRPEAPTALGGRTGTRGRPERTGRRPAGRPEEKEGPSMTTYTHTADTDIAADTLFGFLADPRNLPRYFPEMTVAEPQGGESVHVEANVHGEHVE